MLEAVHHPGRQTGNRELDLFLSTNVSIELIWEMSEVFYYKFIHKKSKFAVRLSINLVPYWLGIRKRLWCLVNCYLSSDHTININSLVNSSITNWYCIFLVVFKDWKPLQSCSRMQSHVRSNLWVFWFDLYQVSVVIICCIF